MELRHDFSKALEERRFGRVRMIYNMVMDSPAVAQAVLSKSLVLRCELEMGAGYFVYDICSPCLEPTKAGELIPEYKIEVSCKKDKDGGITHVDWEFKKAF